MKKYYAFLLILFVLSCSKQPDSKRAVLDLSGTWQFAIDSLNTGIKDKWFAVDLSDTIKLPGTTDLRKKGIRNTDTTTMHLNRVYRYEGPAWYRKKVSIPENFNGKHIVLIMERTKSSMVWIDDIQAGESHLLQSQQEYDLTRLLTSGEHTITIRIDNSLKLTPFGNVHIYSDDTQTNWNGIIGKFRLEAASPGYISDLQVYPDIDKNKIDVKVALKNIKSKEDIDVEIIVRQLYNRNVRILKVQHYQMPADSVLRLEYSTRRMARLWDDYSQPLYELTAVIKGKDINDQQTVPFGMRKFSAKGTQFAINGRVTFLRGKHDACVFPLTGHPPMDVEGWMRVFRIAKSYGINHYRFHSWCPPEAAFYAADRQGIFIQAELPFWGGLDSDSIAEMLKTEGIAMLKNYANHPSFVLFSHGNEIWSGHERVAKNLEAFKSYDSRPLYAMGSNNNIGYMPPSEVADFFVAARTPYAHDTILTHTRLTQAFADSKDGGILNTQTPSTLINFDYAVSQINIPMISHEIGQYQVYPDYSEIHKYTGVLEARNLEVFRKRLEKAGMMDQNIAFQKASGAWAALCYKAEMEAALRTKGLAGFQLLDLQDFPGQGTALVGMLDAFMDDKGVISKNEWLESCNDVVLLAEFPKYCWKNSEQFEANIQVANYSNKILKENVEWQVADSNGNIVSSGKIMNDQINNNGLNNCGRIVSTFSSIKEAARLELRIKLSKSGYSNSYPLWVYPQYDSGDPGVMISRAVDEKTLAVLADGGRVLMFPDPRDKNSNAVGGLFPPEFWNYGMFKGISEWVKKPVSPGTLGILTDPDHPALKYFPTDSHTNWQWFSIIKASNPMILDNTDPSYRPIVQVIDNLERNHKLGMIFEFRVGQGKLLVCAADLPYILDKPEALSLYNSLIAYINSKDFNPVYDISWEELKKVMMK
jgi:hypothetical protein